jgi:hypothetical protein
MAAIDAERYLDGIPQVIEATDAAACGVESVSGPNPAH